MPVSLFFTQGWVMSELRKLQKAATLHDLAVILNYEPKFLAYLIYKKTNKYSQFTIPKSSGAPRNISAPCDELKALQRKVKVLLDSCLETIALQVPNLATLSHGFKKDHSIITNADKHRKKLYVLNIDIQDFFGSIHIGRLRGFFITNRSFSLQPKIATILSQIMCHEDKLPQGSPTSPVASNLIGHLLDVRMVSLASKNGCVYSRYADDITFSTNKLKFPQSIAYKIDDTHDWIPGSDLLKIISKSGFGLNHNKTRMQYNRAQQTVTGLIVNSITHTPASFRRTVRAMAHKLFLDGDYYVQEKPKHLKKEKISIPRGQLKKLEGMFSYIYMVDNFNRAKIVSNSSKKQEEFPLRSIERIHGDFLFYKNFYGASAPTIICEGKTDNVYLTCAIKSLHAKFPELASLTKEGKTRLNLRFINYSNLTHRVLGLNGGSADIGLFIRNYARQCGKYKAHPPLNPTIVIVDNDSGSKPIFSAIKDVTGSTYAIPKGKGTVLDTSKTLYKIAQNLYVILTPKIGGKDSMMEHFFPAATLATQYKGKTFEVVRSGPPSTTYSKHVFAQNIIKANQKNIDFSGFEAILGSIKLALDDYPKIITP